MKSYLSQHSRHEHPQQACLLNESLTLKMKTEISSVEIKDTRIPLVNNISYISYQCHIYFHIVIMLGQIRQDAGLPHSNYNTDLVWTNLNILYDLINYIVISYDCEFYVAT